MSARTEESVEILLSPGGEVLARLVGGASAVAAGAWARCPLRRHCAAIILPRRGSKPGITSGIAVDSMRVLDRGLRPLTVGYLTAG